MCIIKKIYEIQSFLTICLATFDFLLALCQLVERITGTTILQSVIHMALHGSASTLMLLLAYRIIFIFRSNKRIRLGVYVRKPSWTICFYMAPAINLMLMNVLFNYSCGLFDLRNKNMQLMTFITSYIIPLVWYVCVRIIINRRIRRAPRSRALFLRYKIATSSLSAIRMISYLTLRSPAYVSTY